MFRPGPPRDRVELPERFALHEVEIDLAAARASRAGAPIPLEPKAFDLLLLLAANPGRVVEKQEIFERIWPDAVVTDNALARVVAHLRRELGDDAETPRFVETVRTRGYRFLPRVEPLVGAPPPASASPGASSRPSRRLALLAGLLAALALAASFRLLSRRSAQHSSDWSPAPVQRTFALGYQAGADFSPDGSQIVYSADAAGGLELFVAPLDGGPPLQLTRGGGPKIDAAWSPDGRFIAYRDLDRGGLWLVAPTGGPPRQLVESGSQPAWFPDGDRLVFSSPGRPTLGAAEWPATYLSTLFVVEIASGKVRQLTKPDPAWGGHGLPAVSPDGGTVYFATGRLVGGGALFRVDAGGGEPERLVPAGPESGRGPSTHWFDPIPLPSGDALVALEAGARRRIVRIGLDRERRIEPLLEAVPPGTSELALSRDGRRLIYDDIRSRSSIEEVALGLDGEVSGEPRTLSEATATRETGPQYSPDGERLFFLRRRPGAPQVVVVIERTGGEARVLPSENPTGAAGWLDRTRLAVGRPGSGVEIDLETGRRTERGLAPAAEAVLARISPAQISRSASGRWIVYSARAPSGVVELHVGDLESGVSRQLTSAGRPATYPVLSQDDLWVAYQVADAQGTDNEVWRIPVAGGAPERLQTGRGVSWLGALAPDGATAVYAAHRHAKWHLAIASPRQPERLLAVPPETIGYLRWPDWSPDGRHVAYERMHYEANLWTLDLPPSP